VRALKIRQINSAILKVPGAASCMDPLATDSCRETVPMECPVPNGSMQHQNPGLDFDNMGHFLQGALYVP
jgi:hypothetical protein